MKFSLCIFTFFVFLSPLSSAEKLRNVRIALFIEPPYAYFDNNKLVGFDVDLAKLIAKQLKLEPILIPCPVARCFSMMKSGHADIILDINKTHDRQQYLTYLPSYREQPLPLKIYTNKSANIKINSYQDLSKLIIGVIRGYTYFKQFDEDKNLNKVSLNTKTQLINMLKMGRIEAFIARKDNLMILPVFQQYKSQFSVSSLQYFQAVPSYLAISKLSPFNNHIDFIAENLNVLVESGDIENIFQ